MEEISLVPSMFFDSWGTLQAKDILTTITKLLVLGDFFKLTHYILIYVIHVFSVREANLREQAKTMLEKVAV